LNNLNLKQPVILTRIDGHACWVNNVAMEMSGLNIKADPLVEKYKLKIDAKAKLNFFAMTTCHREDTTENPDKGIFKKKGSFFVKKVF